MSSMDTAAMAQEIADAAAVRTQLSCVVAVTTLLAYDIVLTSGQEYLYVWRSSKSWFSRILYAWNRYMSLLLNMSELGTIPSMSDTVSTCAAIIWLSLSVNYLSLLGPAMFTTLRIYALSRKNRGLGGVALVLSLAPFAINLTHYRSSQPINLPAPYNCGEIDHVSQSMATGLAIASRSCLILADSLAVAVTWYQARSANVFKTSTMRRPSLEQVMWDNGSVYFCALVSMNIVEMVLVALSTAVPVPGEASYIFFFIDPISAVLNSRFLLALHETNARMEGANTSISSLDLDLNSDREPRDGSPELPAFLAAVGGPIHSFPDHDDEDWGSVEFAAPSQGGESVVGAETRTETGAERGAEGEAEGGVGRGASLGDATVGEQQA